MTTYTPPGRIGRVGARVHDVEPRFEDEERVVPREMSGQDPIVGREPRHELAPGVRERSIEVPDEPEVPFVAEQPDPRVGPVAFLQDRNRLVRRPIVGDHHLDVRVGLGQHRVDRRRHEAPVVVGRNHDRDQGLHGRSLRTALTARRPRADDIRESMPERFTVLGGRGYLGRHLAEALQAAGHEVILPDRDAPLPEAGGHVLFCIGVASDFRRARTTRFAPTSSRSSGT